MKKPNFFIIGAPKCGTTAMAHYLAAHPDIYISKLKEPYFFNHDHRLTNIPTWRDYIALFENAPKSAKRLGEASVWYMHSKVALQEIEKTCPNSYIITMIRNPAEMFLSLHEQLFYNGREDAYSPEDAWRLQYSRQNGFNLPAGCIEPEHLQYFDVCSLGTQLSNVYKVVPKNRVLIILLDDLKRSARQEYLRALSFLEIDDDERTDFPPKNTAKTVRSLPMHRIMQTVSRAQKQVGLSFGTGALAAMKRTNTILHNRPPVSDTFWTELLKAFDGEVAMLESILQRDLSMWR